MNHRLTLTVSFFFLCSDYFPGIWGGGFEHIRLGYIRFSQKLVGVLGWEETLAWAHRCNKLHSTICTVLLSEFVSWNAWLQHTHNCITHTSGSSVFRSSIKTRQSPVLVSCWEKQGRTNCRQVTSHPYPPRTQAWWLIIYVCLILQLLLLGPWGAKCEDLI